MKRKYTLNFIIDDLFFRSNESSFHFKGKKFDRKWESDLFLHFSITILFVLLDIERLNILLKLSEHLLCTILCMKILQ